MYYSKTQDLVYEYKFYKFLEQKSSNKECFAFFITKFILLQDHFSFKNLCFNLKNPMQVVLVLFLILAHGSCFIDYTEDHVVVCPKINIDLSYNQSLQTLWNSVILHSIDRIMFLVCSPILILTEILFLTVFIKYRQTLFRRQGTIFFSIILIQTTLNVCYFTYALYVTVNPYNQPMPSSFPTFCGVFGVIIEAADSALDVYLFYFIMFTFLNMKTSIKAKPILNKNAIHSSAALISLGWILFVIFDNRLTIDQFGLCGFSSLRYDTIQWFFPIFTIVSNSAYLIFALYTYFHFKKHMPLNQTLVKRLYHENKSISYFVVVYSILIMLFNISIGVVYFNCFRQDPLPQLLAFATMMNFSRILESIFLIYFIMTDQTIKKKTKKFMRSFFKPKTNQSNSFVLEIKDIDFSLPDYEDLDITLKQKILELKQEQHQIDLYKIAQIATIISGICICHLEYFNTKTFSTFIRKIHFKEKITFQIEPKTLSDYGIQVNKLPKGDILKGTISMMAPRIFSQLLHADSLNFLEKSFDLTKNYHKMYNIAEGKGGKSGEFFFFSYDYKYVLKTVTKQQYQFIVENLQQFYQYYKKNPLTLLTKIYGLYTIRGEDIGRQYDMILMKNIFGCQKKQVIRTYDIKGSKHDRQVIKQKDIQNQLQNMTLKDTDFLKLQGKIHISRDKVKILRSILRKDTLFLKNFNLIDYSLLIVRVKWATKPDNQHFWTLYQRIPSSLNENEFYHIGIIDYMQAWNISKQSQNWFKSLIGKREISSQQPNIYQRRFMHFVEQITYYTEQNFNDSRFNCSDGVSDIEKSDTESERRMPQKSNLKILEMTIQSPQSPTFKKIEKQGFNFNEESIIIPHEISVIRRKQSQNQSEFTSGSLEANLMKKTESFNSIKKSESISFSIGSQSLNCESPKLSPKLSKKDGIITFKGFNLQGNQINELKAIIETSEFNEDQSRITKQTIYQ